MPEEDEFDTRALRAALFKFYDGLCMPEMLAPEKLADLVQRFEKRTPEKQLDVSMGWNVWDLATHEAILDEIDELDVARAQTTSPDDKRKIDTLVVDHFGSFAEANTIFRKLVCACFLHAARAALRAGEEMKASNDTGEDLGLTADGGRPLFDAALVELYERKFGEVA